MKKILSLILTLLVLTSCATAPKNTLTQISTIDALLVGAYDGHFGSLDLTQDRSEKLEKVEK